MTSPPEQPRRSILAAACALVLSHGSVPVAQEEAEGAPAVERGLRVHAEGAFEGYTLISPLLSKSTFLVDMQGEVVHRWDTELPPGNSAYLLPNGNLLRTAKLDDNPVFWGGGIGGRIQELTWDGELVWDFTLSDENRCQHHDVEPLPNGNVLAIVWERLSQDEAIELGRDPEMATGDGLWPDAVLEIRPERPTGGEIVWEWHAMDHLVQDQDPTRPNYDDVPLRPERIDVNGDHRDRPPMTEEVRERLAAEEEAMQALGYVGGHDRGGRGDRERRRRADWLHTNAVAYHAEHDLIALSTPRLNEVWILDHSTTTAEAAGSSGGRYGMGGDLLYRWGNPRTYGAGDDDERRLFAQHDVRWIPAGSPGAGNLLVFNNGSEQARRAFSSVDELALPFDPESGFRYEPGKAFGPPVPAWSYVAPTPEDFYSFFISGAQRLPNGNTLICSGKTGRVFEVTREGEIVWEYLQPFGGEVKPSFGQAAGARNAGPGGLEPHALFRATRLAPDHPGLAGRLESEEAR